MSSTPSNNDERKKLLIRVYDTTKKKDRSSCPQQDKRAENHEKIKNEPKDCIICINTIKRDSPIWYCKKCFTEFHLDCIIEWATSQYKSHNGLQTILIPCEKRWNCPICRTVTTYVPRFSYCYCGKVKDPWSVYGNRRDLLDHCCDNLCGKTKDLRGSIHCNHPCVERCHPGPCPPCSSQYNYVCPCGKTRVPVKCSMLDKPSELDELCKNTCDKMLSCGKHRCTQKCHSGQCPSCCFVAGETSCNCGKESRDVLCGVESDEFPPFSCGNPCPSMFECEIHPCNRDCHSGFCGLCPTDPKMHPTCFCGKTLVTDILGHDRVSCKDPIPTCGKTCGKKLPCRSEYNKKCEGYHTCPLPCHDGPCSHPNGYSFVSCKCGKSKWSYKCKEIYYNSDGLVPSLSLSCNKRCGKFLSCLKHRCENTCCSGSTHDHICPLTCNQQLRCGKHFCSDFCHPGKCSSCAVILSTPRTCNCGMVVVPKGGRCGAPFPQCKGLCPLFCSFEHPSSHVCHEVGTLCSPCYSMRRRWCSGNHMEILGACFQEFIFCTSSCGRMLQCGDRCTRMCHAGECIDTLNKRCNDVCRKPLRGCGHECALSCHWPNPCMPRLCRVKVLVTCRCGRIRSSMICNEYEKLRSTNKDSYQDRPVVYKEKDSDKRICMLCDEGCFALERNLRLAEALDIKTKLLDEFQSSDPGSFPVISYNDALNKIKLRMG